MKKKSGFTLIELLAVIVILAIIALIAVPVILNIIEKARISAFKDTAYGIVSAAELYFAEQQLEPNGMAADKEFILPSQANTEDGLQLKGNVPTGIVKVTTDGQVAIAVQNGRYCVTKSYIDTGVMISEDIEDCELEKRLFELTTTTNGCTTNKTMGSCAPGTMFTINVDDNEPKNFYVMKDEGNKVTLIMSENLGNPVAWASEVDYGCGAVGDNCSLNDKGPITAINYLDGLTDDEWSNIPKREYTYNGIAQDGTTRRYEDITRTMRARIITYGEVNDVITANNGTMSDWLYSGDHWTSTANSIRSNNAWYVFNDGSAAHNRVSNGSDNGVRPVIELSK